MTQATIVPQKDAAARSHELSRSNSRLSPKAGLALSIGVGAVITLAFAIGHGEPAKPGADLTPLLNCAREVLAGRSPYPAIVSSDGTGPRMLYPMPAYLMLIPLAWLPDHYARALWAGFAIGALTWIGLRRWGLHGFAMVFSRPAALAISIAQWSPLFLVGALVPSWQLIAAAKPTLGLIVWAYRPTWWAVVGGAVMCGISFLVLPTWVTEWRAQLTGVGWYLPAVAVWHAGGPLLLLASLRWRRPEARLLVALACTPHNFIWYDQLLIFLVAERPRELWALFALTWIGAIGSALLLFDFGFINRPDPFALFRFPIVGMLYLPALWMVLRRPNEGPVPRWLEHRIGWWPTWLRGHA